MKTLITGDSHVAALKQGFDLLDQAGQIPDYVDLTIEPLAGGALLAIPFFRDMGDHVEIVDSRFRYARFPVSTDPDVYGFCAPLHTSRIWRQPCWNKFAPHQIAVDGEIPLSSQMLKRIILGDQRYILGLIDVILRLGKRVFAIEAPRPFRQHPALEKTRAAVIIHLDNEYRRIMRTELGARSVPVVALPPEVYDAEGFMYDRFLGGKLVHPHHGNADFGALMTGEILKYLQSVTAIDACAPQAIKRIAK